MFYLKYFHYCIILQYIIYEIPTTSIRASFESVSEERFVLIFCLGVFLSPALLAERAREVVRLSH